jgi:alpha,alpha-trehalase
LQRIVRFNLYRITVRIKRGKEDCNLKNFKKWLDIVNKLGIKKAIGASGEWNTFWCRGLCIFDDFISIADEPCTNSAINFFEEPDHFYVSFCHDFFSQLCEFHIQCINKYMWCPETNLYYDWDITISMRSSYQTVTTLWALWAKAAPNDRAALCVAQAMKLFKFAGGLVSGTEASRGHISLDRPVNLINTESPMGLSFWLGSAPNACLGWLDELRISQSRPRMCISLALFYNESIRGLQWCCTREIRCC